MSNIERYQYPISYLHTSAKSWSRYGVDTAALLSLSGVDTDKLENANATLSGEDLRRLTTLCCQFNTSGIPESILVAEQFSFTNVGLLGLAVTASEDLSSVLDLLIRFLPSNVPGLFFSYRVVSEELFIEYYMDEGFEGALPFFNEVIVCVMRRFSELFEERLVASKVYFSHTPKYPVDIYQQFLGCPVYTNHTVNRLCFDARVLDVPLKHADSSTLAIIEGQLQTAHNQEQALYGWSQKVYELWHTRVEQKRFLSQKEMANELHISPRTLVRRLAEEGYGYRTLVQQWRLDRAKTLLKTSDRPISDIAHLVGFDDESAFFRFFKDAEGVTPRHYRVS